MRGHRPICVTGPAIEPVTLAEVKAHCRVDGSDEDGLLSALISAAVAHLDGWSGILGRCLISQTWRQTYDRFRPGLRLPMPALSITAITYGDPSGDTVTLDPARYVLRQDACGSLVTPAPWQDWPDTGSCPEAVTVSFVAGYGPTPGDVPASIRHAMLLLIGSWMQNRESVVIGAISSDLPMAVDMLLASHRIGSL